MTFVSFDRCLAVSVAFLLCLLSYARAEQIFDYSHDTVSYCAEVAAANKDPGIISGVSAKGTDGMKVVLCLSKINDIDFSAAPVKPLKCIYGPDGYCTLLVDGSQAADECVAWLTEQPYIQFAELDQAVTGCSVDSAEQPIEFHSWGADEMGMQEYVPFCRQWGTGSAVVAVVDSGAYQHSLIKPKIWKYGYDYVDADEDPTNDLNGHGTHVAGIIADCTLSLPVQIYPVRVLDAGANGKMSNVVAAVLEATEQNVDVINLSLVSPVESQTLEAAIRRAVSSGTTVVVSAGNYGDSAANYTPANMMDAGVIVVGSVERDGRRSSYSNYGASVDVYTYGTEISSCSRSGGYVLESGTSMSAPHVSALCAMLKLIHRDLSPSGIEHRIKTAATDGIVSAKSMVPTEEGFSLRAFRMDLEDAYVLPQRALPQTACQRIHYESSAPLIVDVVDGELRAISTGEAEITVTCTGFADQSFTVTVKDEPHQQFALPLSLRYLSESAFSSCETITHVNIPTGTQELGDGVFDKCLSLKSVLIPDSVDTFGNNDFSSAVILCRPESPAHRYAAAEDLQYILLTER